MCIVELAVDDKDAYRSSRGGMCALWSWVLMTRTPIDPLEVVCVHSGAGCW